ncbi:MAG: GNAT family protein, partial [Xanthomarina sp.]
MRSRLFLKKIITSDIDERVMSWFDDKDLMKYYTSSKNKISKENLLLSIKESEINHVHTFGIFFKENDEIIGTIKIGPIHQVHKTSDLVALIGDKNYLGKGLSVEAIKLGNEIAFSDFDVRRLQGGMYISN